MKNNTNLAIIGGGIMGLFTAYFASQMSANVVLVERYTVGNPFASSSGQSRSIRNDYTDPYFSCLAAESMKYWEQLEKDNGEKLIIKCGVLNIAKKTISPDLEQTYAASSLRTMQSLGLEVESYAKAGLAEKFPQFDGDFGVLDVDAGFLRNQLVYKVLLSELRKRKVKIIENFEVGSIKKINSGFEINSSDNISLRAGKIVLTPGPWINRIILRIKGYQGGLLPVVPIEQTVKYFEPKQGVANFTADKMPVFAYLDVGIYGHPVYDFPGVKIAYFDPTGATLVKKELNVKAQNKIKSESDFIAECLPSLKGARITKVEKGYYEMTPDNNFIIDRLPGMENIVLGCGFNGTGYKFGPIVGKMLAELSLRGNTIYDVGRFSAKRFGRNGSLSMLKALPMYVKYLKPSNWKYAVKGINALRGKDIPN